MDLHFYSYGLYGSLKTNNNVNSNFDIDVNIVEDSYNVLLKVCTILFGIEFNVITLIILIALLIYEFVKHTKNAIIITITTAFQLFIYIFIYSVSDQRAGIFLLIVLLFPWIQTEGIGKKNKKVVFLNILFTVLLTIQIANTIIYVEREIDYKYSAAKETADYINENLKNKCIVCSHIPFASAIIPYTNNNFYSPQLDKYFTFTTWDKENEEQNDVPIEIVLENINNKFKDKENIYFIYCYNWDKEKLQEFLTYTNALEIFKSNENLIRRDEKYIIYKLYNT